MSIDPTSIATTLGLNPVESEIAIRLAEGQRIQDIAKAMGYKTQTVYWYLKKIYRKLKINRQVDLVRRVLLITR